MGGLRPVADVGIVGGGQLARMTLQAAVSLGVSTRVLAGNEGAPTTGVFAEVVRGAPTIERLEAFSRTCAVTTFEHEQVDPRDVEVLEGLGRAVRPGSATLRLATDKAAQRRAFAEAGLPVPAFAVARSVVDVVRFGGEHGWPLVAKAPRGGFDGRGVWFVDRAEDAVPALALAGGRLLLEPALLIEAEVAVVLARRPSGHITTYPVLATVQEAGICRVVQAPSGLPAALEAQAIGIAHSVAELTGSVGILAVELFVVGGRLIVNEIAARPHNSAHLTIDAAVTSQFENHLRAVLDLPLGATDLRAPAAAMANVLATDATTDPRAALPRALALGDVHVHLYGKAPRPGRKIGHVAVLGDDPHDAAARATAAADLLGAPGSSAEPSREAVPAWA
jgi:5-(carboxyamino)imidazole ribonucleotide synthase